MREYTKHWSDENFQFHKNALIERDVSLGSMLRRRDQMRVMIKAAIDNCGKCWIVGTSKEEAQKVCDRYWSKEGVVECIGVEEMFKMFQDNASYVMTTTLLDSLLKVNNGR